MDTITLREAAIAALLDASRALKAGDDAGASAKVQQFKQLDAQYCAAAGLPAPTGQFSERITFYLGPPVPDARFDPPRGARVMGGEQGMVFPGARPTSSWINGGSSLGQAFIDERARTHQGSGGFQAALLETGSTAVAVPLRSKPIEDPRRARFVFELLAEEDAPNGMFSYLKQASRDLNAAVVPTGTKKPVSTFSLERVDDRTDVIAHVSEPIDRFVVEDAPLLRRFVDDELRLGLNLALDTLVVNALLAEATQGDGSVSLTGIRSAITTLQLIEMAATAIVINPVDWEETEAAAAELFAANDGMPTPTDTMARRLYGIPVVVSNGIAAGAVLVGSFDDSALLYVTGGIRIDVSDAPPRVVSGETLSGFQLNEVTFRAERRAAIAIGRPSAFVLVGTTS